MGDEDADGDEEPLPAAKPVGKKGATSKPKGKEKLFKVRAMYPTADARMPGVKCDDNQQFVRI